MNRETLRKGDKLIFIEGSGVLTGRPGDVVTFSNWHTGSTYPFTYFQCVELLNAGYAEHNFWIGCVELFNPETFNGFRYLTTEIIKSEHDKFIETYGGY